MTLEGNILTPQGWFRGELTLRQGRIAGVSGTPVVPEENDAPRLIPGFIDLHVHGGGGDDLMEGGDALATLARTHARFGTTSLLGTSMTASRTALLDAFRDAGRVMAAPPDRAADIMGLHLEGPFISPDRLGAQPAHARPGTLEEFDALDALAPIRAITLAPEIDGHMALIDTLAARGVRVQIGHSAATHDQCVAALQAGARGFTHLYNAMSGLHHRAPGVVGAALAHGDYAELIGDLIHVEPGAVLAARRAIPHLYGVTDATAAAGMLDGEYRLGDHRVFKQGNSVRLADGGLAGSALTMDVTLRNLTGLGLSLEEASRHLSLWPARYLGVNDRGVLAPNYRADIVVLSPQHDVEQVWVAGQPVIE
ncbi:N-acetylglucosamine-6-phosphate deacetylase [Kushneria sp. AK178]